MTTVHFLCALAAHFGWDVHQSDIVTAFLNGDIFEEVYVTQPRGFVKKIQEDKVCKCHKALYGLKQSPRAWYEKADTHLVKRGFRNSPTKSTLYVKREGDVLLIVVLYVDDLLLIIGPNAIPEDNEKSPAMLQSWSNHVESDQSDVAGLHSTVTKLKEQLRSVREVIEEQRKMIEEQRKMFKEQLRVKREVLKV
ncbi:hypothetical protein L7F22_025118 [Adiantum nelumboides]|nr:hypothetical protein [Adiantum nelumboides]